MKHIKMPKAHADAWLGGLRSGEYEQGRGCLFENGAYCCLGVMQKAIAGQVQPAYTGAKFGKNLPTIEWLEKHNIQFFDEDGAVDVSPYLSRVGLTAWEANDCHRMPFAAIADALELEIEYTDETHSR